jgi:hypothetical protein
MGGVSFHRPRPASRLIHAEGYAASLMPPIHNFGLYLEILGLPAPSLLGPFSVVRVSDDTSMDYIEADSEFTSQHYAFLVSEIEFDEIFERIRERRLSYWADPGRHERDQINT